MLSPLFLRHYILNQISQRFKAAEFRLTKPNLLFSSSGMGISTIRFQLRKCQRKDACVHTDCTRFRCQQTVRGSSKRKKKSIHIIISSADHTPLIATLSHLSSIICWSLDTGKKTDSFFNSVFSQFSPNYILELKL